MQLTTIIISVVGFVVVFILLVGSSRLSVKDSRDDPSGTKSEEHSSTCDLTLGCGGCSCGLIPRREGETSSESRREG